MKNLVRSMRLVLISAGCICCLATSAQAQAQAEPSQAEAIQNPSLPNPLTLEYVLSLPLAEHPALMLQQARQAKLQSQLTQQQAQDRPQLDLVGRLAWREYAEKDEDFHLAAVHANQKLYDFGRNQHLIESVQAKQAAQAELFREAEQQLKLKLMQSYFNALLSDFQYRIDNEAMAVAYISFDKAKDRLELKRISDVDYLEMENEYQKILVKRSRSEFNQLQTRLNLANLMGMPKARPDELSFPNLDRYAKRDVKALQLEVLQQQVLESNPQILAMQQKHKALESELQSYQASKMPEFDVDAWAGKLSSYPEIREGSWLIGLNMKVPLYDGGSRSSKISETKAQMQVLQSNMRLLEQQLRDQVADLYFQLKLLPTERQQHQIFGDYADLYLDYSRALYENETATDLGDSMVRLSQANYNHVAWQFKQALLWAELDFLMGKEVFPDTSSTAKLNSETSASDSAQSVQGNPS
ncbi:TolC family protein [Thiomicrorhabdus sp. zzn3]|uniref:TolC family protein n=1 Tax=Thiomicrorhabdus sp. zzn3 TaxID=3039775 RepID=UPI002436F117|nr:TolC family protein [Thiomicrorhabdus sp. zzn3]MDG6777720.1 TolC family protein [Thiomicrorhabdus sp. zzn3]